MMQSLTMSEDFLKCPGCDAMLLPETTTCPECHHVIAENSGSEIRSSEVSAGLILDNSREEECSKCGETVRIGLVRCWKCGSFMRDDIEASYAKMQASERPVIYSPIPMGEDYSEDSGNQMMPDASFDGDDDFILSTELDEAAADFDLDGEFLQDDSLDSSTIPLASAVDSSTIPLASSANGGVSEDAAGDSVSAQEPAASEASQASSDRQSDEQPSGSTRKESANDEQLIPHSEATGGDALLEVALAEEAESGTRKKGGRRRKVDPNAILVYCPNGHRVEVKQRHRGRSGRCPKCKAPFLVPTGTETVSDESPEETAPSGPRPSETGIWVKDVLIQFIDPTKLKLKAGSLAGQGTPVDLWLTEEGMHVLQLGKPGRLNASLKKTTATARGKLIDALDEGIPLDDAPSMKHWKVDPSQLSDLNVVQPAIYAHESMFAGIAVFGEGQIAIRCPIKTDKDEHVIAVMPLSSFRSVSAFAARVGEVQELGSMEGIPLEDEFENVACHYSEQLLKPLQHDVFYHADDSLELELIGWRCGPCGMVVSEDARKKEKIGGLSGKGILKAKCPKCSQKFGRNPLYSLKVDPSAASNSEDGLGHEA